MGCCPKVDARRQNEYGAYIESGKIGNQNAGSEFHARQQANMKAWREATAAGDVNRILDIKFGDYGDD
jgi:hypothetical protein